jgi:hypothetical protein
MTTHIFAKNRLPLLIGILCASSSSLLVLLQDDQTPGGLGNVAEQRRGPEVGGSVAPRIAAATAATDEPAVNGPGDVVEGEENLVGQVVEPAQNPEPRIRLLRRHVQK